MEKVDAPEPEEETLGCTELREVEPPGFARYSDNPILKFRVGSEPLLATVEENKVAPR